MDKQPRFRAQAPNALFADDRADRRPVEGTVARGSLIPAPIETGQQGGAWVDRIPVPVTEGTMRRGRERYDIYCSPCHGLDGAGAGLVARRAEALQEGAWTPPSSLHDDLVRSRPAGHIFHSITYGIRNMPAYGSQIPIGDRWAIVAYVRALQRSQHARPEDVPPEMQRSLR
jgi:mono/diheme cytochrome c family protein